MTDTVRLVKRVAEQLQCSRREAEQYIEGGWIALDGTVVEEPGMRVAPAQPVTLLENATLAPAEAVTILFHKPAGMLSEQAAAAVMPAQRAADDRSGLRMLKRHFSDLRLTNSLAAGASGLLVLTQDWRVARKLIDDAKTVEQEYIVDVKGELDATGLALLNHGLEYRERALAPVRVSWQNETRLRFALKAPRDGQLVHMCESVGLQVVAIKRIRIGRIPMAGLPVGQWRYLAGYEKF